MPSASPPAKPRKAVAETRTGPTEPARRRVGPAVPARPAVAKVAVPVTPAEPARSPGPRVEEPVWLVRAVLLLFLVGFAAFLAREVYNFVQALG